MAVVDGGSKCNLVTGYTEGEDSDQNYGRHRWLAQTFTLDDLYVVFRCRFKSFTIVGDLFYEYAIRATDASGKPTGEDISATTLSPTGESFYSPGKWRRFDFRDFPQLPAGTYALIARVPTSPLVPGYKLRADSTTPTYPLGKAWESDDEGATWTEIPGIDFMFEIWGWIPPPEPPPTPVISNWAPIALSLPEVPEDFTLVVTTDIPVHLYMRWTNVKPRKHPLERFRRGIRLMDDTRYCFVAWEENEQKEAGDTLVHTFIKPDWQICETRYFYFIGTKQAEESPSASPIFYFHRKGVDMYVISLGKLTEAEVLHNHVKLKEGAGVTITRVDADNALEIAAAAAEYEGFGDKWLKYDPDNMLLGSLAWQFDEVHFAITGVAKEARLYTAPMRNWGLISSSSCEIKLTRGPDASGNPNVYAAVVGSTPDIRNNMSQPCIGWMTGPNGQVSCFNGDGVGFKKTDFAWGNWPPVWLKWRRVTADIKFYANTVLVATHNTNLPTLATSGFFALQGYGTYAGPRTIYMTRPHYSAD